MKNLFILPFILIISACAGSGYKDRSIHSQELISPDTLIFVKRDTGYVGSAALVKVIHNGKTVSEIGDKESVTIPAVIGTNTLSVDFTGLASVGSGGSTRTIGLKEGEKAFFTIALNQGLFSTELKLYETNQTDFMSD